MSDELPRHTVTDAEFELVHERVLRVLVRLVRADRAVALAWANGTDEERAAIYRHAMRLAGRRKILRGPRRPSGSPCVGCGGSAIGPGTRVYLVESRRFLACGRCVARARRRARRN